MAGKKNGQAGTPPGQAEQVTKMDAVRRAVGELGPDAKNPAIQGWVRDRFGVEMSTNHVATYRSELRRKQAGQGKPAAPKAAAPKVAAQKAEPHEEAPKPQVQPSPASRPGANAFSLNDILYVKQLVGRFGPSPLHTLIDAFAK